MHLPLIFLPFILFLFLFLSYRYCPVPIRQKEKKRKTHTYTTGRPVAIMVIEMRISEYPNCYCSYDKITATATSCIPLILTP